MKFPGGTVSFKLHPAMWMVVGAVLGGGFVAWLWRRDLQSRAAQENALARTEGVS